MCVRVRVSGVCVCGCPCPRAECRPLDVGGCAHAVICGGTLDDNNVCVKKRDNRSYVIVQVLI